MSERPEIIYQAGPCPVCAAHNAAEAEGRCKPSSDETGEYFCPTSDGSDWFKEGPGGAFLFATPASIAAQDAWLATTPEYQAAMAEADAHAERENARLRAEGRIR